MSGRTRMILAAVAAFLVVLLFYVFAIRPRNAELADLRSQVEQENNKTIQLNVQLDHLKDLQANAAKAQAELARIKQYVPENHESENFIFQVEAAALESGVKFFDIQYTLPKTPPEGAAVAEVPVTLGARGGYFAIQDFIRRLYSLKRALRIDTLALSSVVDEDTGVTLENMTVTARIFYELPEVTTPPPVVGATPAPVPVASPTAVP
jgi:Tfp pilus assembly protein PilO